MLISILKTTLLSSNLETNKVTEDSNTSVVSIDGDKVVGRVDEKIENLSIDINFTKSKKLNSAKFKKSNLAKLDLNSKKSNFAKTNFCETDFFTLETKRTLIYLEKSFIKTTFFYYFESECHIRIETNILGYIISVILSQLTLDQHFSDHVTHKNRNNSSKVGKISK